MNSENVINGVITDSNGEFSIELPAGVWSANAHDGDGGNGEYWSDRYDGILYIDLISLYLNI